MIKRGFYEFKIKHMKKDGVDRLFSLVHTAGIAPIAARSGKQSAGLFGLRKGKRKRVNVLCVRLLPQTPPRRGRA